MGRFGMIDAVLFNTSLILKWALWLPLVIQLWLHCVAFVQKVPHNRFWAFWPPFKVQSTYIQGLLPDQICLPHPDIPSFYIPLNIIELKIPVKDSPYITKKEQIYDKRGQMSTFSPELFNHISLLSRVCSVVIM